METRTLYRIAIYLVAASLACARGAWANDRPDATAGRIESALARHAVKGARVGISVRRISDGKEIFARRAQELFEIASNAKLFTAAAALWRLGPGYQFRTRLLADGKTEQGRLIGSIWVVGGGDPSFSGRADGNVMRVPQQMAAAVKAAGIEVISGDLIMDDRFFDRVHRPSGWPKSELLWWYAAPVSALSFNDNCVDVKVTGGATPGAPAQVSLSPPTSALRIVNKCVTGDKNSESAVTFERGEDGSIVVGGRVSLKDTRTESIAVDNPPILLAEALRLELEKLGVRIMGGVRLAQAHEKPGPEAVEILLIKTPLREAVAVANRRSQNFYAEQIFKLLGAERYGTGSFETGAQAVMEFAQKAHLPSGTVLILDGSGLSRGNRATPQAISALLEVMYRSGLQEAFYESLAVSGEPETTLRNRMADPVMRGRIHAKTGTIKSEGISALSGYAEALDRDVYTFSILSNEFEPGGLGAIRAMEDAICAAIVGAPEERPAGKQKQNRK